MDGSTPLMAAAYNGDIRTIVRLVKAGAQLNTTNHEGSTATAIFMERFGGDLASVLRQQHTPADGSVRSKVKQAIAARAANFKGPPATRQQLPHPMYAANNNMGPPSPATVIPRSRSSENLPRTNVGSGVSVSRDLEAGEVIIKRTNQRCTIS